MGERTTLKKLALDLGMSVSTVSRAFYPDAVVAAETREAVLKRASELGFRPNPIAQSMITKKTRIVGVVVPMTDNPFYLEMLSHLTATLQRRGMSVMLTTGETPEDIDPAIDKMLGYGPDVLVVMSVALGSDAIKRCDAQGIKVIFVNRLADEDHGYGVACDNEDGGRKVADFLIGKGRKALAFVSGFSGSSTNRDRRKGFSERIAELGIAAPVIVNAEQFSFDAGYRAAAAIKDGLDGVFCSNDILALGLIAGLKEAGGPTVPQDLSVVGFDDITMSAWPSNALTTVAQPVRPMLSMVADLAQRVADGEDVPPETFRIPCGPIIERGTTP